MSTFVAALGPWFGLSAVLCVVSALAALVAAWRGQAFRCARLAYLASCAGALSYWGAFFVRRVPPRYELTNPGPLSDFEVTLLCAGAAWLLLGVLLFGLGRKRWTVERAAFWLAITVLSGMYINVVRERHVFGDVFDFVNAAHAIARGLPLHERYLYPPLLATLLAPLSPYGNVAIAITCLAATMLGVPLAFLLLHKALQRYGFSELTATLAAFAALCANTAVLRTLFYVQTNLHVTNLMLISLLCYPSRRWGSALALALAAHIKTSPLALVLPFVINRDWKWLAWFAFFALGIIGFTSHLNGFHRYTEFLENVSNIYRANGITLRENSLDSLVRVTYWVFGIPLEAARTPILVLRTLLCVLSLWLLSACWRRRSFSCAAAVSDETRVLDGYPVLMLFLMSVSPLVWEHHPVIILLSLLVPLKRLDDAADALLWLAAWYLCFLVPTFDIYPFSFRILLGVAFAYTLLARIARREPRPSVHFARVQAALARLSHSSSSSAPPVSSK
ncbi:MAG TPA: glycosyltransferase 87 family protein [Polyangiales bacterium]|nr:glycosyltransferase 87 family protein [Polyangiales bacterium]